MPRQRGGVTVGSSVSEAAMASAVTTIQNQSSGVLPGQIADQAAQGREPVQTELNQPVIPQQPRDTAGPAGPPGGPPRPPPRTASSFSLICSTAQIDCSSVISG